MSRIWASFRRARDVSRLYLRLNHSKLRKENYSVKGIQTSDLLFEHFKRSGTPMIQQMENS